MARFWGLIGVGLAVEGIAVALITLPHSVFWHGVGWTLLVLGLLALGAAVLSRYSSRQGESTQVDSRSHVSASPVTATHTGQGSVSGNVIQHSTVTVTQTVPGAESDAERQDLVDVDHRFLIGRFEGLTSIQAAALVEPYLGKLMKLTVRVADVTDLGNFVALAVRGPGDAALDISLALYFAPDWRDRLRLLRPDQEVTVIGRINSVNSYRVDLRDCELV